MADNEELVKRLKHLVSLNDAERGGPYQGIAAQACVEAMCDAIEALSRYRAGGEAVVAQTREAVLDERARERLAREIAVTFVDARHGYTMEFAQSPAAHRDEYDEAERAARYAIDAVVASSPAPEPKQGEGSPTSTESRE